MKKEDLGNLTQLLSSIKDAASELDEAVKGKDLERANAAKRKVLTLQVQIDRLI